MRYVTDSVFGLELEGLRKAGEPVRGRTDFAAAADANKLSLDFSNSLDLSDAAATATATATDTTATEDVAAKAAAAISTGEDNEAQVENTQRAGGAKKNRNKKKTTK